MRSYLNCAIAFVFLKTSLALPGIAEIQASRLPSANQTSLKLPADPLIITLGSRTLEFSNYRSPGTTEDVMYKFIYDLELAISEQKAHEHAKSIDFLKDRVFFYEDEEDHTYFKMTAQPTDGDRLRWSDLEAATRGFNAYLVSFDPGEMIQTADLSYYFKSSAGREVNLFASGVLGNLGMAQSGTEQGTNVTNS